MNTTREHIRQLIDMRQAIASQIENLDRVLIAMAEEEQVIQKRLRRSEAPERMSVSRASRYLGISRGTMYKLIDQRVVPSIECRVGSDRVVVRKVDLDSYVSGLPEQHRVRRTSAVLLERAS